jgi:hypothetical protein
MGMSYQQLLERLNGIEVAVLGAGQKMSQSRLGKYKRDIARLADPAILAELPRHFTPPEMKDLFFTVAEVFELRTIFEALMPQHSAVLIPKLRELLSGPSSSADEVAHNKSAHARNVQFELFLMAQLATCGFRVIDGTLTDVRFIHAGREFLMECKRPQAATGIRSAVRAAVHQLLNQPRNRKTGSVKVVALSLTKVLYEGTRLLRVYDEREAGRVVREGIEEQINGVLRYAHQCAGDGIAGIFAYASASVLRVSEAAPANVMMQVFFNNPHASGDIASATEEWWNAYEAAERTEVGIL